MTEIDIQRALEEGAQRSRDASVVPSEEPWHRRIWTKHRWLIIAVALFLLIDILVMSAVGGVGGHF